MTVEELRAKAIEYHSAKVAESPWCCRFLHETQLDIGRVGVDVTSVHGNNSGKYTIRFYLNRKFISKTKLEELLKGN